MLTKHQKEPLAPENRRLLRIIPYYVALCNKKYSRHPADYILPISFP